MERITIVILCIIVIILSLVMSGLAVFPQERKSIQLFTPNNPPVSVEVFEGTRYNTFQKNSTEEINFKEPVSSSLSEEDCSINN